jgi:hypothetical protein
MLEADVQERAIPAASSLSLGRRGNGQRWEQIRVGCPRFLQLQYFATFSFAQSINVS